MFSCYFYSLESDSPGTIKFVLLRTKNAGSEFIFLEDGSPLSNEDLQPVPTAPVTESDQTPGTSKNTGIYEVQQTPRGFVIVPPGADERNDHT